MMTCEKKILQTVDMSAGHYASTYRTGNICCRSEAMKRYIGTCLPHAGRYMQSRTGAVTQVSTCTCILPQTSALSQGNW